MNKIQAKNIIIKTLESILVTGYILFEELIWNVFAKPVYRYFTNLIVLDSLKRRLLGMNRYLLLALFIIILGVAEAMGFLSGGLIINGYFSIGIVVYALKIPIAAFTFWLFELTEDQLMTFQWLKATNDFIMDLIDKLVNSSIHVYIKARMVALKELFKQRSLQYFGAEGIAASIKNHFWILKSRLTKIYKQKLIQSKSQA